MRSPVKAAFLDRDGVINEERGFVHTAGQFAFLPGAIDALRELRAAGYLIIVVTNQSGIARGLYTEDDYLHLTAHMCEQLRAVGVWLDDVRYCPHLPDAPVERYRLDCSCRKPLPGMLTSAIAAWNVDPAASILMGDRVSDIRAGRAAGVGRCYLIASGSPPPQNDGAEADAVYASMQACVRLVVGSC